jgi:hypothetical protein
VVISDCRFPNEIEAIKKAGGKIYWVQRGDLPAWYEDALSANQGNNVGLNSMKMKKIHASEWAWIGCKFDGIIDNNGSIDELYDRSKGLVIGDEIPLPPHYSVLA